MSTTRSEPGSPTPPDSHAAYARIYASPEFAELRRRFRRFVFPVTVGFLAWYFLYVLAATFAHGFMNQRVVGNINVALVFGLLQFLSTFLIAVWYARRADRDFDPLASKLHREFEEGRR